MFKTEVVHELNEEILNGILRVNRGSFPTNWIYYDAEEYYRDMLKKRENIHIVLKYDESIVGYLLAIPHNEAVKELTNDDPEMKNDPMKYYIETTGILPEYRGKKGFSKILDTLILECKKKGIAKLSLHARVETGLSMIIQTKFKANEVRRVKEWRYYNYQEPADYIDVLLDL